MVIHQLSPAFVPGDAIGNQAQAMRTAFRSWGMRKSQAYAQFRDMRLADCGKDYRKLRLRKRDCLIYHYGIGSPVSEVARRYLDRLVFYYHNVTPSRFLRGYNDRLADLLDEGRADLPDFRDSSVVWAASDYDRQELLAMGFRGVTVLPLRVDTAMLQQSAASANGRAILSRYPKKDLQGHDWVNWLFVGRIVPNKRQDALIRAFFYYQRLVQPRSRLFLVGSDVNAPGYQLELESLAASLGVQNVIFAGAPSFAEGFGGYFTAGTVFVCASEHEGFCVPIVEAMAFGLPVVALNATGVPCAVADAGLLVDDNSPATLAEAVHLVLADQALRERLAQRQQARVAAHAPAQFEEALRAQIEPLLK
jgi:glycosyltransferase involved in cell wall biosynthesis